MLHLEKQGRVRDVVRLGEVWAEQGEPTVPARLAHARALLTLCLVDRAWAKLRELDEKGEGGVDTAVLLARMFLERGWPHQARKPLEKALAAHPEHPELVGLWSRLSDTIAQPDDDDGDRLAPELQLRLAERHLLFNNLTRARALLERVRRAQPEHARVADLLWAMEGNLRPDTDDLGALVQRWGPDPLSSIGDLPEFGEHTDHTESVSASELLGMAAADHDPRNFPQLFRGLEPLTEMGRGREREEVTAVTSLAALAAAQAGGDAEWSTSPGEDTQIVRVVARPGPSGSDLGRAPSSDLTGELERTDSARIVTLPSFDLAALKREAGQLPPARSDLGPEREDEDVVVVKRREASSSAERETIPAPPERTDLPDEAANWARKNAAPSAQPTAPPVPPPVRAEARPAPRPEARPLQWQWWLLPVAGLAMLLGALLLAVAASQVIWGLLS